MLILWEFVYLLIYFYILKLMLYILQNLITHISHPIKLNIFNMSRAHLHQNIPYICLQIIYYSKWSYSNIIGSFPIPNLNVFPYSLGYILL